MLDNNQPTAGPPGRNDQDAVTAPIGAARPPGASGAGESSGHAIGPYTLLEIIGEGGFGTVWLAERREPMVQRVALKIIKPGMDSAAVIARFEQERQALAVMDHPNVARVFDGGVTERGRPYFVMEYVNGQPITSFADHKRLKVRQRLELFISVCDAVQHAHMKGIIHRDLKPSNILVEEIDSVPVVKVIDFGVAKAITQSDWAHTAYTQEGMVIGTPEYMSPEQVLGELDVDTRSDVYSLGVVLYELLTGQLPFESSELRRAGLAEIQRIIREQTPPKPSTRLSESAGERTTAAASARATSREQLTSELRRELDWVPLMALRKERDRRYPSPQALAEDIQRYLDGRPLRAAPDSRVYLARKFVRRNRVQVGAAAAVFIALAAGLAVALWQRGEAIESQRAEARERTRADERAIAAERAEAAATAARDAEKERADQLKKVSDFQSQMLSQIDTTKAGVDLMADVRERFVAALEKSGIPEADRTARLDALRQDLVRVNATDAAAAMIDRTILRPAIKTIDEQFKNDPATDASLRQALADLYRQIGLYDEATPLQDRALRARRDLHGDAHEQTLESVIRAGELLLSRGQLTQAEPLYAEALTLSRRVLGESAPRTIEALNNTGVLLQAMGRLKEAEDVFRESREAAVSQLGPAHSVSLIASSNLGQLLASLGELQEAETLLQEANRGTAATFGPEHPNTLRLANNLALVLQAQGRFAEAEALLVELLRKFRSMLGEEHPDIFTMINNLGSLHYARGDFARAEPYLAEALVLSRRVLGIEHPDTLHALNNMSAVLLMQNKLAEAEPCAREAMQISRRILGPEHPGTLEALNALGFLLQSQAKYAEAEPFYRERLETARKVLGERSTVSIGAMVNIGELFLVSGRPKEAIALLEPSIQLVRASLESRERILLARLLKVLSRARLTLDDDAERFTSVEPLLVEAHEIERQFRGEQDQATVECVRSVVNLYTAWDKAEPGKGYDAKAAEWKAKLPPAAPPP